MKKIIILSLVTVVATMAFAQNPEALKTIKKAKSADDVTTLIKQNETTMSAAENAQAYNKLVDIYMKDVDTAKEKIQTNEAMKQMGQEPKENVDMAAFYTALEGAYIAAMDCDKYDIQPNDKGKVAPKFRKANAERLYNNRLYLINAAQDAQDANDDKKCADLYALYVITGTHELFADVAETAKMLGGGDAYLSEVARVASLMAYQNGDAKKAMDLVKVVIADPEKESDGISMFMYYTEQGLKSPEDSIKCLDTYKELYEKYPSNDDVFSRLASMYANLGQEDKQNELIAQQIKAYPNSFAAWAMKGQVEISAQDYDTAIADLKKALTCDGADDGQKALVNTFVGFCYSQKAVQFEIYEDQKNMLQEAVPYFEEARRLDPNSERANWGYPLYNCYYHLKGENDPATEELKTMLGL